MSVLTARYAVTVALFVLVGTPLPLHGLQQADLQFPELVDASIHPGKQPSGGQLTVNIPPFNNVGPVATPRFHIAVVLSPGIEVSIDPKDPVIYDFEHDAIPASGFIRGSLITVPIPPGQEVGVYRVAVVLDSRGVVDESNETNNTAILSPVLNVVAPIDADLLAGPPIITRFAAGAADQLLPEGSTRIAVAPGGAFFLRKTVIHNQGSQKASGFTVAYYVSDDAVIERSDRVVGSFRVTASVSPLGTRSIPEQRFDLADLREPQVLVPGDYYFGIIVDVDNEVGELAQQQETNNNTFVVPLRVLNVASDTVVVWRAELFLRTGTRDKADTDDPVFVGLSKRESFELDGMMGNDLNLDGTWLDYAHNDFEKGAEQMYDIRLVNIGRLRDVTRILLGKQGTDGWCVASAQLDLNGHRVFSKSFPNNCDFLDGDHREKHIGYLELRSHAAWPGPNVEVLGFPDRFTREDIEQMVQTEVGNFMFGTETRWKTVDGVRIAVSRRSSTSVAVQLGVEQTHSKSLVLTDASIDIPARIDFDIRFESACNGSTPEVVISVDNVEVEVQFPLFAELMSEVVEDRVEGFLGQLNRSFGIQIRPIFQVTSRGDVEVQLGSCP